MDKLRWCRKQERGIRVVPPNEIISKDYIRKADDALLMAANSPSREWKVVGEYYACYNALYSLLQKAGIKCEIHDCSIELMPFFGFLGKEAEFLRNLKQQRINAQYYVDRHFQIADDSDVKRFVLSCKEKLKKLDFESVWKKIEKGI